MTKRFRTVVPDRYSTNEIIGLWPIGAFAKYLY